VDDRRGADTVLDPGGPAGGQAARVATAAAEARPGAARIAAVEGIGALGHAVGEEQARCVGPPRAEDFGLCAHVETTDARQAAALVPSSDADLLLQCPRITKAEGGHIANACSRLATISYDSMPALLPSPARRDEPVAAG
jgi:hypothetical protein